MLNEKFKKIYLKLCTVSVFRFALTRPPVAHFMEYCTATDDEEKLKIYAKFVSEIYDNGGNLTDFMKKVLDEDENAFVKSLARGIKPSKCVSDSASADLEAFSEFSSLAPVDFIVDLKDLGDIRLPNFYSNSEDLAKYYHKRIKNIERYGYGKFASHSMFRLNDDKEIEPIASADKITMERFIGYDDERAQVVENTQAFVDGRPALNTLLYGDAGTGKSSTVKAVVNAFFDKGVRLIELRKDQLCYLPFVMSKINDNPLKFIIFIDDLSFNRSDDNFSMLKAALEGSASAKADNAVIYATSNRRHIIKESFGDRDGDDVHRNDTMQETLSLAERFGLTVFFAKPSKELYLTIVKRLAKKWGVTMDEKELEIKAEAFALRRGNRSARCAEQFIELLVK
ncbi:MAG: ATP-binding protein [Clostridia bacterium]|nr:ATP-binding protein [Clostridia bacterium]